MDRINFINGQAPALNGTNLNQLQTNVENAINEVDNKYNYSTEEQVIGTWQDKPLYRKVVSFSTPTAETQNVLTLDTSSLNIKWLLNAYGPAKQSDGSQIMMKSDNQAIILNSEGNIKLYFNNSYTEAFAGYLTLEYTKTTD